MFKALTYIAAVLTAIGVIASDPHDGPLALLVVMVTTVLGILAFRRTTEDKEFITHIFLVAMVARLLFGIVVHVYELRDFAGPDSMLYDEVGGRVSEYWRVGGPVDPELESILSMRGPGWGMHYIMGFLYLVFGKSIFAAQSFCAVVGAAVAPMLYLCSYRIFHNVRVARSAAVVTAFFPAFIIWSSQLLKDGLIVFLLVLAMTTVLQIQRKFSVFNLFLLIVSLLGVLSLRFYIFYMVVAAVLGSFIIGVDTSLKAITHRTLIIVVAGLALTYVGVIRTVSVDLNTFGSMERLQITRSWMNKSAESGYASEGDVSTVGGALSAMPVGLVYLLLAPFPWEMKNLRQTLTLPDVLLWWAMWPLIISGLLYTIRHRLREGFPVVLFTLMLTLSYSVFQGNLGAAYRQRTQIQVFLFLFFAVGLAVLQERRADKKLIELNRKRSLDQQLRGSLQTAR